MRLINHERMLQMNITIRKCMISDAPYIRSLSEEILGFEYPIEKFEENIRRLMGDPSNCIYVAENQGTVLGFAYLAAFNPRSAYRRSADLSIYVRADCLHAHVGSLLLMHIEELARAQGIANIISIITGSNERSCAFHEKNGFVLEGVIHEAAMKFGVLEDVRFYRKKL